MNYLHVGYPKCGSSFLQNAYFTQENGFCNLLIHAPHEFRNFITHDLLISDSMSYSGNMPAITEHSVFKKIIGLSAGDFITFGWRVTDTTLEKINGQICWIYNTSAKL